MDAFFVSVELLRRPELRGKPVVVATGTDAAARGVVMAASYEARRYGVHSALPLAIAHRRCPQATLIPRDFALYQRASRKVMDVLGRFSDLVEVAGLDEAYLDLSECPAPKARARQLKHEMRAETRLVCSVGLAPNKLLAKIASDLEKPDGLCVLEPDGLLDAVGERPATLIPGVGPRTAERLAQLGVRTVADAGGDGSRRRWNGPSAPALAASFAIARAATTTAQWSRSASGSRRAARPPSRPTSRIGRCSPARSTAWPTRSAAGSPRAATRVAP